MNRVYRHMLSKALGRVIVVAECSKGAAGRTAGRMRCRLVAGTALIALQSTIGSAWAQVTIDGGAVESVNGAGGGTLANPLDVGAGILTVGDTGTGTLNILNGGTVTNAAQGYLGVNAGSSGTVTVDGASTLSVSNNVRVGGSGTGSMLISGGGTVNTGASGYVAFGAGSGGEVTVTGSGSKWAISSHLFMGAGTNAALTVSGGGLVTNQTAIIGRENGATGRVNITGSNSRWSSNLVNLGGNDLFSSKSSTGTLTISDGGKAEMTTRLGLGLYNAGATGLLNVGAADGDAPRAPGILDTPTIQFGPGTGKIVLNHTGGVATPFTLSSDLSGPAGRGSIEQMAGRTELTGDASGFSGTATVTGGTLIIGNSFGGTLGISSGTLIINSNYGGALNITGGTVGGNGTLNALNIPAGAKLAPGNSIGTTNVVNATFAPGSTYEVEIKDGGFVAGTHNDRLNATGTITINGGSVHVKPENGADNGAAYAPGTYTIATATGGVTGTFDPAVTDDFAFLNFSLSYNAMNVLLSSQLAASSFCKTGMSANQCAAGAAVFGLGAGNTVYDAVLGLSDAAAGAGLDQLSGEGFAATQGALSGNGIRMGSDVLDRIERAFAGAGENIQPLGYFPVRQMGGQVRSKAGWVSAFGGFSHLTGNTNAATMSNTGGGLLAGADMRNGSWLFGGFAGAGYTGISLPARNTSLSSADLSVGAYVGRSGSRTGFALGAAYTRSMVSSTRNISVGGINQTLTGNYGASTISAFGEVNTTFGRGGSALTPYARAGIAHTMTARFSEAGGSAALSVAPASHTTAVTELGVRAQTLFAFNNVLATVSGGIGWRQTFGNAPQASNGFGSGTPFGVSGTPVSGSALIVEAGFGVNLPGSANLDLSYGGQFGSAGQAHKGRATLGVRF
ncbi:autotransporter domain-containing protein [Mesorhizobium sp. Z1-4]|uniref:autotransporter outer membrane beta-barrel domain-containing protein n=1 Tax=Mesorhizobium sp. Z1-4 TaxID=2448478 RepID=UPI000FD8B8AE|nr:autotransporter domain-containing protein [Mesorhizobium sp. Z1-4]